MAADARGNDIQQVAVAVDGTAAIAPFGTAIPTAAELADEDRLLEFLASEYRSLGLRTTDGAPEWTEEPEGDPIEFFEEGYTIPTGNATVSVEMTLAETSPLVAELRTGNTYDANGVMDVRVGSNTAAYALVTETVYANGTILRRACGRATARSVATARDTRGEVTGHTVTFDVHPHDGFHYREALVVPEPVGG